MKYIILVCLLAILITGCAKSTTVNDGTTNQNNDIVDDYEPVACGDDTKLCDDGSNVARNLGNNCEFDECPAVQNCDAETPCPQDYECWKIQTYENPVCLLGSGEDICMKVCGSPACDVAESYPPQVFCE